MSFHPAGASEARRARDLAELAAAHLESGTITTAERRHDGSLAVAFDAGDPDRTRFVVVAHDHLGWSLPGGHREQGESIATTAARELVEETGLVVDPDEGVFFGFTYDDDSSRPKCPGMAHLTACYSFEVSAQALTDGAWSTLATLASPHPPDMAPIVSAARRALTSPT